MFFLKDTFWTNPQYKVQVVDPDEGDDDNTGTLIVALMQKDRRKKIAELGLGMLPISYGIYKVRFVNSDTELPITRGKRLLIWTAL